MAMEQLCDLQTKYNKIATEYSKLRAQIPVLKKAFSDEQAKHLEAKEALKERDKKLRIAESELDSLSFRNEQLRCRVNMLQQELEELQMQKKGHAPKGSQNAKLIHDELGKKLIENSEIITKLQIEKKNQEEELQALFCKVQTLESDLLAASEREKKYKAEIKLLEKESSEKTFVSDSNLGDVGNPFFESGNSTSSKTYEYYSFRNIDINIVMNYDGIKYKVLYSEMRNALEKLILVHEKLLTFFENSLVGENKAVPAMKQCIECLGSIIPIIQDAMAKNKYEKPLNEELIALCENSKNFVASYEEEIKLIFCDVSSLELCRYALGDIFFNKWETFTNVMCSLVKEQQVTLSSQEDIYSYFSKIIREAIELIVDLDNVLTERIAFCKEQFPSSVFTCYLSDTRSALEQFYSAMQMVEKKMADVFLICDIGLENDENEGYKPRYCVNPTMLRLILRHLHNLQQELNKYKNSSKQQMQLSLNNEVTASKEKEMLVGNVRELRVFYEQRLKSLEDEKLYLKSKYNFLHMEIISSKARLMNEVNSNAHLTSELNQLKDEISLTTENYETQLSTMSDHIATLNETIQNQKDDIEELQEKINGMMNKKGKK